MVQSYYSVCIAYANFKKRMQISEKKMFLKPRLLTTVIYKRMNSLRTDSVRIYNV